MSIWKALKAIWKALKAIWKVLKAVWGVFRPVIPVARDAILVVAAMVAVTGIALLPDRDIAGLALFYDINERVLSDRSRYVDDGSSASGRRLLDSIEDACLTVRDLGRSIELFEEYTGMAMPDDIRLIWQGAGVERLEYLVDSFISNVPRNRPELWQMVEDNRQAARDRGDPLADQYYECILARQRTLEQASAG